MKVASIEDFEDVKAMLWKFLQNTGYKDYAEEEKVEEVVSGFLLSPRNEKIVLISPGEGMLAGLAVPFVFGTKKIAAEQWWWVEPDHRGKGLGKELLETFEFWAKTVGCDLISMSSINDEVGGFYEKQDYKLYERAYMKEL